jgi:hypothetical protein
VQQGLKGLIEDAQRIGDALDRAARYAGLGPRGFSRGRGRWDGGSGGGSGGSGGSGEVDLEGFRRAIDKVVQAVRDRPEQARSRFRIVQAN